MKISNLPHKDFKVAVMKMLTELGRRVDEYIENFHEETENIRKYQMELTKLKNTIIELKNILR